MSVQQAKKIDCIAKLDATGTINDYKTIMASVETFKNAVIRIRDILRGPGVSITGMDSMRHICLYLLSRYMTRAKVASLEVPEEFAWETFIETAQTKNGGVQKALDCFYHAEEDCLVRHFDRLFGTDKFSFDIKSPQKHKEILEILNAVNMAEVDCQMDILGWVYEQHLKTGSSSAGRDLGQFFTDRFICEYMTELCKPGFKCAGVPESVCDPSMGTGGFLTAFIKYYKKHHADKPIDWSVQQKEIHGCDTDPRVAGVSRLNLFMETGGNRTTNLLTHDSLYGDLTQTGYDVILANMPFGLKGIKHAECCERVKALKIRGTKSEPLFLQLMMVSLNMGGRCAVVVPDGMLVNSSSCHNDTRKYLLDHFELKRVIKMKGQFFMNTGIQPSILFFEKTGKPTETVEFWEVVKGDKGEINETMVVSVPRAKIDATSSFDMRRYLESEKPVVNPTGFPMVKLGDLYEVPKTIKKFNSGDMDNTGDSAFFNGKWDCPVGKHSEHSFTSDKDYFVIIKDGGGDHSSSTVGMGKFFKVNGKCSITSHNVILVQKKENNITHQYVYYYMTLNAKSLRDKARYSINLGSISMGDIMDFPIQLPPLPIQQEIVATLDRIYAPGTTELADTLKMTDKAMNLVLAQPSGATLEPIVEAQRLIRKSAQMVVDVKTQMVAIVKASMAGPGCAKYILSDLANDNPENLTKADKFETINYVDLGSVKEGNISAIQNIPFGEKPSRAQRKIQNGDIIWGGVRPLSRSYAFIDAAVENMVGSSGFVLIRNKDTRKVVSKYLYYVLTTDDCVNYLNSHSTGSSYPAFNASTIMAYEVVIPSIDIQKKTLERLETLQFQLTALESLQRQSEDNARFILESYVPITPSA
jgi:restriction endonuclease S subunit